MNSENIKEKILDIYDGSDGEESTETEESSTDPEDIVISLEETPPTSDDKNETEEESDEFESDEDESDEDESSSGETDDEEKLSAGDFDKLTSNASADWNIKSPTMSREEPVAIISSKVIIPDESQKEIVTLGNNIKNKELGTNLMVQPVNKEHIVSKIKNEPSVTPNKKTKPVKVKTTVIQKPDSLNDFLIKRPEETNQFFVMRSLYANLASKVFGPQITFPTAVLLGEIAANKAMTGSTYPEEIDVILRYIDSSVIQ